MEIMDSMHATVLLVFGAVYLGMVLGEIPGLRLDRAGIALLGAIALVAAGAATPAVAWASIDAGTIVLLFGLMIVSAQLRLGGFYTLVVKRLDGLDTSPPVLLAGVIVAAGGLSALLANDIVCLALAPILVELCARRGLNPVPFLLGLACASNVGSAATLIGNPQNMLIGQTLGLSFARYLVDGGVPALAGLAVVWAVIAWRYRTQWLGHTPAPAVDAIPFNAWHSLKGGLVLAAVVAAFLAAPWPHEAVALAGAGVLLTSRRMDSRDTLGLVDWQLLVLFMGLFVVNTAVREAGLAARALEQLTVWGMDLRETHTLFGVTVVLSNVVSNVPAVMLLLPAATFPGAGATLALASTLAGNLLIVGSIANIIVIDQARRLGVEIDWRTHARVGVPVTVGTLAIAALWLSLAARY
jgi:Na+/H+ antiporter NhaD/arsenite permease-like protein